MFVVRPIQMKDLGQLHYLATSAQLGITSLPKNKQLLEKKIEESIASFSKKVTHPDDELYFFVLEDTLTRDVIGSCALYAKVGHDHPILSYCLKKEEAYHKRLNLKTSLDVLHPSHIEGYPTEVATLFLSKEKRKGGLGRLLSLSRFVFMSVFRSRVRDKTISEMRGFIDPQGHCPFWSCVGEPIYHMDFATMNLKRAENPDFMEVLRPQYPIYCYLLPESVRQIIGKTYPTTLAGMKMLESEGFKFCGHVDITDAGPDLEVTTDDIRTIKNSAQAVIKEVVQEIPSSSLYLISNCCIDFRCCLGNLQVMPDGGVTIEARLAQALKVEKGEKVCYVIAKDADSSE